MANPKKTIILTIAMIVGITLAKGQSSKHILPLSKEYDEVPITQFLADVEESTDLRFFYKSEWLEGATVSGNYFQQTAEGSLREILKPYNLDFTMRGNTVFLHQIDKLTTSTGSNVQLDQNAIVIGESDPGSSVDTKVTVSGFIQDGKNDEELFGATVFIEELQEGVATNKLGYYTIEVLPGLYRFKYNYIGYEPTEVLILVKGSGRFDIDIFESSLQLKEVEINEDALDDNVSSTRVGTTKLDIKTIERMPAFLGEVDVVRSLLLLPGVTTVGEGAAGFNVRGGSADQNLFLFDDVPVFNAAHLFGFFSSFNPEVVKNVTLYKGGIPAKYGNRASSVLDVTSKDANNDKFKLSGGIGLVSSRVTAELPIIKKKSSLLVAARSSYSDWILNKVNDLEIKNSSAQFYDINAKWTTNFSKKDRVSLSGYLSADKFKFAADPIYSWKTQNLAARWNHLFSNKLSSEVSVTHGDYSYDVEGKTIPETYLLKSGINNKAVNLDFAYIPTPAHKINVGGIFGKYTFKPGVRESNENLSTIDAINLEEEFSNEMAIYLQDNYAISDQVSILAGIRFSKFDNVGPGKVINYAQGVDRNHTSVLDTTYYSENETIKSYQGFEPRVSLKYSLSHESSLKLSYNKMRQYIHIISNSAAINPIDIWKSSDPYIAPQIADQISAGYFRNFRENEIESSIEVYYKKIENIIDYKNGAVLLLNPSIEQVLLSGKGRAYGVELYIKKKTGRLTGWASYTYSRTERQIKGISPEETINNGEFYPSDYDKPHNLSVVGNYQITRRWRLGANFAFSTGRPVTVPQQKFTIDGTQLAYYSERNADRIPNYHRLDFSVTLDGNHKKKKILDGSWTFSLYNVYARKNAFSVFFKDEEGRPPQAYRLSILGTIFPSVSYNFDL